MFRFVYQGGRFSTVPCAGLYIEANLAFGGGDVFGFILQRGGGSLPFPVFIFIKQGGNGDLPSPVFVFLEEGDGFHRPRC